jgi:hypothetical protein
MHVDKSLHHPALVEMVAVARELVKEEDEELARETLPTFNENLIKLQKMISASHVQATKMRKRVRVTSKDPGGAAAKMIMDMRANVCAGNPELHADKCDDFMKQYCAENAGSQACANFYGKPKEPEPVPTPPPTTPAPTEKPEAQKKPSQQQVPGLPSQGFDGEEVAHVDGETATDDWRVEFGPGQPDTYDSVCSKHPNNEWCRLNGYGGLYKAAAYRSSIIYLVILNIGLSAIFI